MTKYPDLVKPALTRCLRQSSAGVLGHVAAQTRQFLTAFWPRSRAEEGAPMSHKKRFSGGIHSEFFPLLRTCGLHISCWLVILGRGPRGGGRRCSSLTFGRNHRVWPVGQKKQLQELSISVGLTADEEGRGLREKPDCVFGVVLLRCYHRPGLKVTHTGDAGVPEHILIYNSWNKWMDQFY